MTQQATKNAADALKLHISEELTTLRRPKPAKKEKLVGLQVKALGDDDAEMGVGVIWDVVHEEQQTWTDGQVHKVVLLKAEGQPTLSREFSKVSLYDPFVASGRDPVRVSIISRPNETVQYFIGWRGTVAEASKQKAKVNFAHLTDGKIAHTNVSVPTQHLKILAPEDISMLPNQHPLIGKRCTVDPEGAGEIVHVAGRGSRVKVVLDGGERKGVMVDFSNVSFEEMSMSNGGASIAEALPPQAPQKPQPKEEEEETPPPEAAQKLQPAEDEEEEEEEEEEEDDEEELGPSARRRVIPVGDSDAESDDPPQPKRRRGVEKAKAKSVMKRSAGAAAPSQPKRRARRKVASSAQDVN